jgi:arsenate reductase
MPGILFLCIHNAGRSQMAAGFARQFAHKGIEVFSGGSEPGERVNPIAVEAMSELDIDISAYVPVKFSEEMLHKVDVVVTMGCGDVCPVISGKTYRDWSLRDPKGQPIEVVRSIRDDIQQRVEDLVTELIRYA